MKVLTPAERRGAWAVLLLLALGSAHDYIRGGVERSPLTSPEAAAPAEPPTAEPHPARASPSTSVDLNRADSLALDGLPGIGPVLTARILAHRRFHGPFRSPEELLGVRGVGPALYAKLKDRITIESPPSAIGDSAVTGR